MNSCAPEVQTVHSRDGLMVHAVLRRIIIKGGNVVNSRFLTSEMQKSTHKTRQLESPATLKFNILSAMTDIIARW